MSDKLDPFEEELGSFRPRLPSADLKTRLAAELTENRPAKAFHPPWRVAAGLAAACLLVGLLIWQADLGSDRGSMATIPNPTTTRGSDRPQTEGPTLSAYTLAARQSVDDLDVLLDAHAKELLPVSSDDKPFLGADLMGVGQTH
jgi:hypothetical protein